MNPQNTSNINLMAPHPALNEEEDKTLRLKRAKISIDRITGYNGQRLLMNASRLLSALRWAILLDGPASIPAPAAPSTPTLASELTEDLEDPAGTDAGAGQLASSVRPWCTRLWQQLVTKPLEHVGFAFFVGLIPVVGPFFSLWLGHKLVYSKLNLLKLSGERFTELEHAMVRSMTKELLIGLCLPVVGSAVCRYIQPRHAMRAHAEQLFYAQAEQNMQRIVEVVDNILQNNDLSLEDWEHYNKTRKDAAPPSTTTTTAYPSLAPPSAAWGTFDGHDSVELMPVTSGPSTSSMHSLPLRPSSLTGDEGEAYGPVLGYNVSFASSMYTFSVHRASSVFEEIPSVADGNATVDQSSSSAIAFRADEIPPCTMPDDSIVDAIAMAMDTPISTRIPQTPTMALGNTLTKTPSLQHAVALFDSSTTTAMPPYLAALLASKPPSHRANTSVSGVTRQRDGETGSFPMTVLQVNRVIISIPWMPEVAVRSTSSSAASATSSSAAVPSTTITANSGLVGLTFSDANTPEASDVTQYQVAQGHGLPETDFSSPVEYNTLSVMRNSPIPPTSQSSFVPVETVLSSSSTMAFSTESSPSLSTQEQTIAARPPSMATSTEIPEDFLAVRLRDLSAHMAEAGPARANSSELISEDDKSPAATIAAVPSDSPTASTSSTSSSTLSTSSVTPTRPRHRVGLLQVPTFATAGRLHFSSSNESSSDEGNGDYAGHDEIEQGEADQERVAHNEPDYGDFPGSSSRQDVHQDNSPADRNINLRQLEGVRPFASNDDLEDDDGIPRDEFDYKIVRPVVRLRPGHQLRSYNQEDLFSDFDSVSGRLGEHDRQFQQWQAAREEGEPLDRDAMDLGALGLGVSDSTNGALRIRNLDLWDGTDSVPHYPQDTDAANAEAALVSPKAGMPPATTHTGNIVYRQAQAGGLAQGYVAHIQNVSQASRAAQMQAFVGVAGDKTETKDEDQDNGQDVETQVASQYGEQWQSIHRLTQHPTLIQASQDRRESILSTLPPLHPPPLPSLPPRPDNRPLTILKKLFRISSNRDSMPSTSSAPPPPQQQQQQHHQTRAFTNQPLATQQQPLPQHVNQQHFQQSLDFRGAPTYHQHLAATGTDNLSNEISVPLGSSNSIASMAPPTTTTSTGAGAGAGGEWQSNPTPPTDQQQATSLLLCAPFIPQFDSDDDDMDIPPVVAVRVPNSRVGVRLPFQNQSSHRAMFERQQQQQQQIPCHMLSQMSQSLHHGAPSYVHLDSTSATAHTPPQPEVGATFGLGDGGGSMTENRFPQISEPTHIFGQRLIQQEIEAVRSRHDRHEQDYMYTSRNNVACSTPVSSFSSIPQPLRHQHPQQVQPQQPSRRHHQQQTQSQQPLQYQQQPQLPPQYHLHQQPLQPQHQPQYQVQHRVQHQVQEGGNHPTPGEKTTYDPTEDLDDNGVDADAAFMSARQFQDPYHQLQQQQQQLQPQPYLQSTTTNNHNNGGGNPCGDNSGFLVPPLRPWLTGPTSSSQYPSSRTVHPRLLLQQQEQLRQQMDDQRVQRQQHMQIVHQQQQIPTQNIDEYIGFPPQQNHSHHHYQHHQQAAQIYKEQRESLRQLKKDREVQGQEEMAHAQRQEHTRPMITRTQRIPAQHVQVQQVRAAQQVQVVQVHQQQAQHGLQVRAQQVQVQQAQGLQELQGQWQGQRGLGQTGTSGQLPLPSLLTDEQNRQLDWVLYGGDKQELDEEDGEGE